MKKLTFNSLLIVLLFSTLFFTTGWGQVVMDSTVLSSNSARDKRDIRIIRHSLVEYVEEKRFQELQEHVMELNNQSRHPLMVMEEELLYLFNNELDTLVYLLRKNEVSYFRKRNNRTYLIGYMYTGKKYEAESHYLDKLSNMFLMHLTFNEQTYKNAIDASLLNEEKKLFLYFYIDLLIYYNDLCTKHYEHKVLDSGEKLVKKFPNTFYANFAKKYKRHEYSLSDWGWNVNAPVLSMEIPLKRDMYRTVKPFFNVPFLTYSLGWNYKNVLLEYEGGYAVADERATLTLDERDSSRHINAYRHSLVLGYRFELGEQVALTPFIGRRHLGMRLKRGDHDVNQANYEKEKDLKPEEKSAASHFYFNYSSRAWFYGLTLEINMRPESLYECGTRYSRTYHRFTLGLTHFDVPLGQDNVNGNMLVFQYAIGIQTQRRKGMARF